jgi:hypothetical protein
MRERWISPQMVTTNRISAPGYQEVRKMARDVIKVLKIGTSATHMEWFAGPKGLRFSEIGCRPPGVGQWDVYNAANEFDLYFEWAHALVHGTVHTQPSRRFAAGMISAQPAQQCRTAPLSQADRRCRPAAVGGAGIGARQPDDRMTDRDCARGCATIAKRGFI